MKTHPNKENEFYIKVKGDYGQEKECQSQRHGRHKLNLITDLGWDVSTNE